MSTAFNKYGFPIEECSRCDGSGRYSYNPRDGHTCFGCSGTGQAIAKPARKAWAALQQEISDRKRCAAQDLNIGDSIAVNGKWCKVMAMSITPRVVVTQTIDGVQIPISCKMYITLETKPADEIIVEVVRFNSGNLVRRHSGDIDVARFLAMIPKPKKTK